MMWERLGDDCVPFGFARVRFDRQLSYAPNKKALAVDSQGFFIIEVAGHGFEPWTFGL